MSDALTPIAGRLIRWYARHGRKNLPWQRESDPLPGMGVGDHVAADPGERRHRYYERFMARFPALAALADAPLDDVLGLWTGLGYYSRSAQSPSRPRVVVRESSSRGDAARFSTHSSPCRGIGRSTAGAILALSHGDRHPILDGNVKRVLCRYHGVGRLAGGGAGVERTLWTLAERHTPREQVAVYTQAIMDLRRDAVRAFAPRCARCVRYRPNCAARREGAQARIPGAPPPARDTAPRDRVPGAARPGPARCSSNAAPPAGIWGGLWCFPECEPDADVEAVCRSRFGVRPATTTALAPIAHGFTPTSSSTCIRFSSRWMTMTAPPRPVRANLAGIHPALS